MLMAWARSQCRSTGGSGGATWCATASVNFRGAACVCVCGCACVEAGAALVSTAEPFGRAMAVALPAAAAAAVVVLAVDLVRPLHHLGPLRRLGEDALRLARERLEGALARERAAVAGLPVEALHRARHDRRQRLHELARLWCAAQPRRELCHAADQLRRGLHDRGRDLRHELRRD